MTTVLEAIDSGTRYLEKRGIEDARRNMQMLVAKHLRCSRIDLYLQFDRLLDEATISPLRDALRRRAEGVPLQHLLGTVVFHRREFLCDARALIPRPETEELLEVVLTAAASSASGRVLDMGCGSGVLGLTLAAEWPAATVTLADVSPDALALARENAARLAITNAVFVESDLFANLANESFDLVVANLPYVAETDRSSLAQETAHEPAVALFGGPDGLDVIRRFVPAARRHLKPGALVAMEIGHDHAPLVMPILQAVGLTELSLRTDLSGIPRFPLARMPNA